MNRNELRKGNYVDVIVQKEPIVRTRCQISSLSDDKQKMSLKDLSNNSIFVVDSVDKWKLVEGIVMSDDELRKLGFEYDENKQVYMLLERGAWVKDGIQVQKYEGIYELVISKPEAYYCCKTKSVSYVHLLQNAVSDIYGYKLK